MNKTYLLSLWELFVGSNWQWETAPQTTGAGIVVVRKFKNWKYLGLWAYGGFDIPKGHVESGDDIFETATRETKEEAGIDELNFNWGREYIRIDNLFVYIASTEQDFNINFNKEENIFEHEFAKWLNYDEMYKKTYDYLRPAINWAKKRTEN